MNSKGHNTKILEPPNRKIFGWNDGDTIGFISYQFLQSPKSCFGINLGRQSVYVSDQA